MTAVSWREPLRVYHANFVLGLESVFDIGNFSLRMDSDQDDERVIAMKALLAGVRQHGTYKKYMRAPHREFLAVRGLAQRGKLSTEHRALNFIAKLGERGVVWNVLTYWRPTE